MNFSHSSPTVLTFDSQIWTQSDRSHTSWMSLQRHGDRGHEIKLRKLAQVRGLVSRHAQPQEWSGNLGALCGDPPRQAAAPGSTQWINLDCPSAHLPAWHYLLKVLFVLLFHLPLRSRRQLQEHMEVAWQLPDTDAGLCNGLSSPLLPLLSVSLAAWVSSSLPAGGVCAEVLVGCEALGDWRCWAGKRAKSSRSALPFSHSSAIFNCSAWLRMISSWPGGK